MWYVFNPSKVLVTFYMSKKHAQEVCQKNPGWYYCAKSDCGAHEYQQIKNREDEYQAWKNRSA